MQKITILGAGFLGLELGKRFQKTFEVSFSSSSKNKLEKLQGEGFNAFLFNEKNLDNLDILLNTDYLFINYPPSKYEDYLVFLEKIYSSKKIKTIKKIIFVSSTSIYSNEEKEFFEDMLFANPSSKLVYKAEQLIKEKTHVIFRCAGLMGGQRIAGRYFSGKEIVTALKRVNHVHRDDVIKAVDFVIANDINGVFNLCAKEHPFSKDLYLANAKKYGFEPPIFIEEKKYINRIINGSKIEKLGFEYIYPNPLEFSH